MLRLMPFFVLYIFSEVGDHPFPVGRAEAAGDDAGKAAAKEILGDLAIERKPFDGGVDFICSNRLGPDGKPIQLRVGKEKKAP